MPDKKIENPIKEVVCNCGKTLGFVKIFDVERKCKKDCMHYPWSLASVTEMRVRSQEVIDRDEAELKRQNCTCKNWNSIPD